MNLIKRELRHLINGPQIIPIVHMFYLLLIDSLETSESLVVKINLNLST
jgi:hypothetical protein